MLNFILFDGNFFAIKILKIKFKLNNCVLADFKNFLMFKIIFDKIFL